MKKIAVILAALMLVLSLTSCAGFVEEFKAAWDEATTQTFEVDEMNITLKGVFVQQDDLVENVDAVFFSLEAQVMVSRLTYRDLGFDSEPNLTAQRMAEAYVEILDSDLEVVVEDGLVSVTDEHILDGTSMTSVYYFYTSDGAYWLVQMYCPTESFAEMQSSFNEWAGSVTFDATTF